MELPRLRDGDTIFHDTAPVTDRARHRAPGSVLLALLCWTSRRGCPFAFASLWWTMSSTWVFPSRDDQASRGPPPDEVRCKAHRGSSVTDTVPAGSFWSMLYWSLAQLGAYLPAYGSPVWERQDQEWVSNLDDVCALQARLHSVWWSRPLRDGLPTLFPSTYHAAWGSHPLWAGGVPDSLLISTDGSGLRGGSWAFVVWACYRSSWYRVGWDGMDLSATPWCHAGGHTPIRQQSYISELTALQAAAIWCLTAVDRWQLWMSASPKLVSVVVDNAAALQVAAGHGAAAQQAAQHTRVLWQAVQSRVNTSFRHVHSHVGVMANTIVDALAGLHLSCPLALRELLPPATRMEAQLTELGPYLWLVPRARMMDGSPFLRFSAVVQKSQSDLGYRPDRDSGHCESADPEDVVPASPDVPSSVRRQPISLNILTANVQTMKDAKPSIFNPSGHAARRQYLLQQVSSIPCDVLCVQEARSCPGRWATGGWLSWRSGHSKGQCSCKVWVRPGIVSPPLTLSSWRILVSTPRIMMVTCTDGRLPLTICSAHAPHADRPLPRIEEWFSELTLMPTSLRPTKMVNSSGLSWLQGNLVVMICTSSSSVFTDAWWRHPPRLRFRSGLAGVGNTLEVLVKGLIISFSRRDRGKCKLPARQSTLTLAIALVITCRFDRAALHCPRAPTRRETPRSCSAAELTFHGDALWQTIFGLVSNPIVVLMIVFASSRSVTRTLLSGFPGRHPLPQGNHTLPPAPLLLWRTCGTGGSSFA